MYNSAYTTKLCPGIFYVLFDLEVIPHLLWTDLHSSFGKVGAHGQAFTHDHIRVVSFLEGFLQRLELLRGEGCSAAALLPVLRAVPSL